MAIQGNINQLLNTAAYFAKPYGDKKREMIQRAGTTRNLMVQQDILKRDKDAPLELKEEVAQKTLAHAKESFEKRPYYHTYLMQKKAQEQLTGIQEERHLAEMRKAVSLEEERKKFRAQLQEEEKKKQEEALLGGKV